MANDDLTRLAYDYQTGYEKAQRVLWRVLASRQRLRDALEQERQKRQTGHDLAELHIAELIADKDRLWGENDAMRPIVEAVAEADNSDKSVCYEICPIHSDPYTGDMQKRHTGPCRYEQARAFVAQHPAQAQEAD